MKKIIILSILLLVLITVSNGVVYEDSFARLTVTPDTAYFHSNGYSQSAELCSKVATTNSISIAFLFDKKLVRGKIYDVNGNDVSSALTYWNGDVSQYGVASDKDNVYYTNNPITFTPYECKNWSWNYQPNSIGSPKWDLYGWVGNIYSPTKSWLLDPYFNTTQYKNDFNTAPEIADFSLTNNITILDGNLSLTKHQDNTVGFTRYNISASACTVDLNDAIKVQALNDGSNTSADPDYWVGGNAGYIYVDLGTPQPVDSTYLVGIDDQYLKTWYLSVSNDTSSWTDVISDTNTALQIANSTSFPPVIARYWRYDRFTRPAGDNKMNVGYLAFYYSGQTNNSNATYGEAYTTNITSVYSFKKLNISFYGNVSYGNINITVSNDGGVSWLKTRCNPLNDYFVCNGTYFNSYNNKLVFNITMNSFVSNQVSPRMYNISAEMVNYISNNTLIYIKSPALEGENGLYTLNVTFDLSVMPTITNVTTIFYYNGSTRNLTKHYNTSTVYVFESNFSLPFHFSASNVSYPGSWYVNVSTTTGNILYEPVNFTQSVQSNIKIDSVCNSTTPYNVLNISYVDEVSGANIYTTNIYTTIFDDGIHVPINLTGNFTNQLNSSFCTNVNPSYDIDWDMTGQFIVSKTDYATRITEYTASYPLSVSNNPSTLLNLYLVGLSNSTTTKLNFYSTDYSLITGTLRVYSCNNFGVKTLIAEDIINNGVVYENLILTTQPYSYSVIVDGVEYTDSSYYNCHIEYTSENTYFVNLASETFTPVGGLSTIDCTLEENPSSTVVMNWGVNPQSVLPIQACLLMINYTSLGRNLVDMQCTNTTSYTFTYPLPVNYDIVQGMLVQGSNIRFCSDYVRPTINTTDDLGSGILFVIALMLIGVGVMLAEDGMVMSIGVAIVLGGTVLTGFTVFGWATATFACIFLLLTGFIARYTMKRD